MTTVTESWLKVTTQYPPTQNPEDKSLKCSAHPSVTQCFVAKNCSNFMLLSSSCTKQIKKCSVRKKVLKRWSFSQQKKEKKEVHSCLMSEYWLIAQREVYTRLQHCQPIVHIAWLYATLHFLIQMRVLAEIEKSDMHTFDTKRKTRCFMPSILQSAKVPVQLTRDRACKRVHYEHCVIKWAEPLKFAFKLSETRLRAISDGLVQVDDFAAGEQ